MKNLYDIVIIGSGPGGYISAIRASQLGFKIAIIEKHKNLGGTCLNVGCIPSKSLLESSKRFFLSEKYSKSHGIFFEKLHFDLEKMMYRKNKIIENLNNGINYLIKKNKIDIYKGIGVFQSKNILSIKNSISLKEEIKIHFKFCIISTGSKPLKIKNFNYHNINNKVIYSTEALNMNNIPKKLIIIGGGIIGIELGSIFSRLGSKITIIDSIDRIISNMDISLSKGVQNILKKHSINIQTSLSISDITLGKNEEVVVTAKNFQGENFLFTGDYCLVAIGRVPYTKHLELENIGIKTNEKGFIIVNDYLQSSVENIYAIGDVIGGKMLAHKAEEEGLHVIEHINGKKLNKLNYHLIPSVIYTYPEVASVGYTENEIINKKIKYNIGIFPMKSLGRAHTNGCTDGFLKMISNKKTDEILGIHIIGEHAGDMIMEGTVAMEFYSSSEDIYRICHPHPTLSEAFKEAALLNFENRSIHM
ncbi:dihydrolipoyl dehydrogenase [Blattabacterium cuenoti]|uniref:dihydrolipoyl dehydrogenase n=1 Tax=Blattabacterium cuenoti TaxID=1653831 RepID=UPI00163B8D79|nr:dihydrolipoyl dehydrogenase [Blattabacterium cuenoti]